MVDPSDGTPIGGNRAIQEVMKSGVPEVNTTEMRSDLIPHSIVPESFAEINNALRQNRNTWVKIKPQTTVSGSEKIIIDPLTSSDKPRSVILDFRQATLDFSDGNTDCAIEVLSNFVDDAPAQSDVHILVGELSGPNNADDISGIRGIDVINVAVNIGKSIHSFGRGLHLRNEEGFCENWRVRGNGPIENCARPVKLEGASETGGSGTDSMMGFECRTRLETRDSTDGKIQPPIGLDMRSVNLKQSYINTKIFTRQANATGVRYDNVGNGGVFHFNIDGSDSGETGIDVQTNARHEMCTFTFHGLSTEINMSGDQIFSFAHFREGMKAYNANTEIFNTRRGWFLLPERSVSPEDYEVNSGSFTLWRDDGTAGVGDNGSIVTSVDRPTDNFDMLMTNYRGETTGTPRDAVAGDAWIRTDTTPEQLRIKGTDGTIRHFSSDGKS